MKFNPLLDTAYFHNDDITVIGPARIRGQEIEGINLIRVNTESAAERNLGYIRESIAARKAREEKENRDAAGN